MVHRVEEPDDVPFDFDRVRNGDLAVEQVPDGLGDHGLAVAGRAVDEHRVSGGDRGADLVEHPLAEHEVRERVADARRASRCAAPARTIRLQVFAILAQRHRRDADVVVLLQEQQRAPAALRR